MSQLTVANYANATPVAADSVPFVRVSDDNVKTVTIQQLANLLQSLANLNLAVSVISANQTLVTEQLVIANSGGVFNLTLPANSLNTGRGYRIFNKGAGTVTVLPNGADTIAGAASLAIAQYASATLYADGLGMWATL